MPPVQLYVSIIPFSSATCRERIYQIIIIILSSKPFDTAALFWVTFSAARCRSVDPSRSLFLLSQRSLRCQWLAIVLLSQGGDRLVDVSWLTLLD